MKKKIRLSEGDLHRIVKNTVRKIINEASDGSIVHNGKDTTDIWAMAEDLKNVRSKVFEASEEINAMGEKYGYKEGETPIDFYSIWNDLDRLTRDINKNIDNCSISAGGERTYDETYDY